MALVDFGTENTNRTYCERDYCTKEGAEGLAERIRNYWKDRGYEITTSITECGFHPTIRHSRWVVHSTLKDGYPPKKSLAQFTNQRITRT